MKFLEKNKPKIVIDLDRMKYPNTGMYQFCHQLYLHFRKNSEFEFWFYKHKKTALELNDNIINIQPIDNFYLKAKKTISVWHTTSQLSQRIPKKGVALVYTLHDLNFLYSNKPQWKINRSLKKIQKNIDRADYLTFISHFTKKEIATHFDIKNKKSEVVYNGVELQIFPDFETPRIRPTKPFLYILGVIAPKKNIHSILCLLENNNYELVISGMISDKKYYEELILKIKEMQLEKRVHFTFEVSEEEKYWYYNTCEAFLFPSISEGFGLPPIEAMRLGKPVFLSTYTSLPEIGGKEAYYFEDFDPKSMQKTFQNGLEDYTSNPNKKEAIIEWSLQFTWEKAARSYLEIYKKLSV